MKKSLFIIAFIFTSVALNAQIKKGDFILSGGISFSKDEQKYDYTYPEPLEMDGPSITTTNTKLGGGYFITDKLTVGLGLGYDNRKETSLDDMRHETESNSRLFYVAPGLRYYSHLNEKFSFFGEFSASFGFGKFKTENLDGPNKGSSERDINSFRIGLTPGFNYMMTDHIGFEINYGFLGYDSYKISGGNEIKNTGIDLNVDFSTLKFGIVFVF